MSRPAPPPLREVIRDHGLSARRGLGQHFLLDGNLTTKIARAAGPLSDLDVLEAGPGPGGLTRALLAAGARCVVAIERDPRCIEALTPLRDADPARLILIEGDALSIDIDEILGPEACVVANLPYNIATPLILGWLARGARFRHLTVMVQKEVATRIVAAPGGKAYGRLAVACQWRAEARALFDVPARAFTPPPKVTSTVVRLVPRDQPLAPAPRKELEEVARAAFGQRRKMLRASLKAVMPDSESLLSAAGIEPTRRAETLSIEEFCALARGLAEMRAG